MGINKINNFRSNYTTIWSMRHSNSILLKFYLINYQVIEFSRFTIKVYLPNQRARMLNRRLHIKDNKKYMINELNLGKDVLKFLFYYTKLAQFLPRTSSEGEVSSGIFFNCLHI